ncbi:hypothetical protein J8J27_27115, partial [Mycobacterium tuberculosis]|nr:hypothetical protein [Mycobacterium tuberculosis]
MTLTSVETVTGGDGDDTVAYAAAMNGATVDLGEGSDQLVLSDGGFTGTVASTETILGSGVADDSVTLTGVV